jgi:capsular polysaccharide biosynthesis protein
MGGSGGLSAFVISFRYENRYAAQKVTRNLMSRFMDENIRDRSSQSQLTTQFLREEYEKAKAVLDSIQKKLTDFRMANIGRLPDQMSSNLQQVSSLESRISSLNANASRANQEKLLLESELRGYRERLNAVLNYVPGATPAGGGQRTVREPVDEQLAALDTAIRGLERQIDRYLEQYSPNYPDVKRYQARLATVKKEREEYLNKKLAIQPAPAQPEATPVAGAAPVRSAAARSPEAAELQAQIEKTQAAIRSKEIEAERYIREITEADRKLKEVHSRIESGPIGAGQLDQLLRDYDLAKARYDEMNSKVAQSETATEVETRKQGETLEVLDLPSLPESPADPNRYMIILGGTAAGLMLGAGLVFAREMKDQSLKSLKDVRAYTQFNVLGSVPLLENDLVVRRRRRIAWLAWSTACLLSVFVMSGSIYYYFSTQL